MSFTQALALLLCFDASWLARVLKLRHAAIQNSWAPTSLMATRSEARRRQWREDLRALRAGDIDELELAGVDEQGRQENALGRLIRYRQRSHGRRSRVLCVCYQHQGNCCIYRRGCEVKKLKELVMWLTLGMHVASAHEHKRMPIPR